MPSSEKEEHDLTRELFVKDLISCIEAQNEVTKSEEETQKGIALKCVGKMKFDYAEVSSKELQSLSREVDLMVDRVRERGDLEANGRVDDEGVEIEFDLKVLENISVGANKQGMDGVVERENFARRDRDFDDGNEVYVKRDGFRKLAIQVFVEFASFLIEGAEERANAVEGILGDLNDEEEASKRLKSISENHSNSIEMLNTILLLSACFASAGNNNNNDGIPSSALWRKEGAFHETLVDILASTKEQEKRLVEDAKRRLAERRGQNEKKCNESDEEEDDNSNISSSPTTISSDAKVDPESEKARDIASASARVLKDLVAASVLGDSKAIRKSD